jgi:hypothetical protein
MPHYIAGILNESPPAVDEINEAMMAVLQVVYDAHLVRASIPGAELFAEMHNQGFSAKLVSHAAYALLFKTNLLRADFVRIPEPSRQNDHLSHPLYLEAMAEHQRTRDELGIKSDGRLHPFVISRVDWSNPQHVQGLCLEWLLLTMTDLGKKVWAHFRESQSR